MVSQAIYLNDWNRNWGKGNDYHSLTESFHLASTPRCFLGVVGRFSLVVLSAVLVREELLRWGRTKRRRQKRIRALVICDGSMEAWELRCDVSFCKDVV